MRAALCQLRSTQDLVSNRRAAGKAVAEAVASGADVVVLPEAMQCAFGERGRVPADRAENLDGPFVQELRAATADSGAAVVAGMFERIPEHPGKVHNTVVVVQGGELIGRYRKLHLYDALGCRESTTVLAGDPDGDGILVVPVQEHVVGVMTCYDLRFPEVARCLVDQGATVLAIPAAWLAGPGKPEQWRVLLQARALENTCHVLAAGQPGPACCGLSMVVSPRGHVRLSLDEASEGVETAEVGVDAVVEARRELPLLESRRFDVRAKRARSGS